MTFEWNERKNRINIRKHGLSFEKAVRVFDDEDAVEVYDDLHSTSEERYIIIGRIAEMLVITVVCTYRDPEIVRIISARQAKTKEKEDYYGTYQKNHLG